MDARLARIRAACTRSWCSTDKKDFTLDGLLDAAFDSYMPAFDDLLPPLVPGLGRGAGISPTQGRRSPSRSRMLRQWDKRWAMPSVPTSLASF